MLSSYARTHYADVVTGTTSTPTLWMALTTSPVTTDDTGSTIDEAVIRTPLPGDNWTVQGVGIKTYDDPITITVDMGVDVGDIVGYALTDAAVAGNVLFYDSLVPIVAVGPLVINFTGLSIEVPV